jgi:hypothetical protein
MGRARTCKHYFLELHQERDIHHEVHESSEYI